MQSRRRSKANLAWIDLEMTGLDPIHDVILQAALIITDNELNPLETFSCDIWQPEESLQTMTPFVRSMHEKNSLLKRVRASTTDLRSAERHLLDRISSWCNYPAVLCGNSISQDKKFLDQWMPGLAGYLSYRVVDVTSVKLLARTWYGERAVYNKPEEGAHDALVDIQNSIAELKHYRSTIFCPAESPLEAPPT